MAKKNIRFYYGGGSCVYRFWQDARRKKDADTAKENITTN